MKADDLHATANDPGLKRTNLGQKQMIQGDDLWSRADDLLSQS